ncbi:hypothetical protein XA68_16393 [Ophiocordyceps unilateralis]|uniref:Ran-specific GTPase-activating protein 30 n=1 Tax=Ophiocordyceps unilateralis TaxID=268505 RepID=A0A2A9P6M8_OPHUN|nr:hypothetical protein XA68_16393 [Ophiocordyceps unilateralis]
MDDFLAAVGVQAMKYAIRSGIALTSTYALGQCSRLLKTVDDKKLYGELARLQKLLDGKMRVITPAIDLIEFKSGRGNVFLESAVPLTKSLHQEINSLGRRIALAASLDHSPSEPEIADRGVQRHGKLCEVIADIRGLLDRIDREIPLLQLAITASGESLSASLPPAISPSRLLQASTLIILADTQYARDPTRSVQIGPAFNLSVYMLFLGHASQTASSLGPDQTKAPVYGLKHGEKKPLWQEVIHKARVRLCRSAQHRKPEGYHVEDLVNGSNASVERLEFSYHLEVVEDFNDGRVHEDYESGSKISTAGIRETIPVYQLSKIFYTDTGRILNIGKGEDGENSPVLLLKRDPGAPRPLLAQDCSRDAANVAGEEVDASACVEDEQAEVDRQLREESAHAKLSSVTGVAPGPSRLPKHFDPEWIALEVYEGDDAGLDDSETEGGSQSESGDDVQDTDQKQRPKPVAQGAMLDSMLAAQVRNLALSSGSDAGEPCDDRSPPVRQSLGMDGAAADDFVARSPFNAITSSLSLIEMLIRLAGLQEFQQTSHLSIPDHVLTFFLEETSTTGLWTSVCDKHRSCPPGLDRRLS